MELAPQPGSEIWPVLLQLLIVRGNCKKLLGGCVALSDPGLPLWGRGRWGAEGWLGTNRGWRYNPRATKSYLVLVIGAQAIPGLWVILSVPAEGREEEG